MLTPRSAGQTLRILHFSKAKKKEEVEEGGGGRGGRHLFASLTLCGNPPHHLPQPPREPSIHHGEIHDVDGDPAMCYFCLASRQMLPDRTPGRRELSSAILRRKLNAVQAFYRSVPGERPEFHNFQTPYRWNSSDILRHFVLCTHTHTHAFFFFFAILPLFSNTPPAMDSRSGI